MNSASRKNRNRVRTEPFLAACVGRCLAEQDRLDTQIIFASDQQKRTLELIERLARSDTEILISGPSGVGKELFAEHAHRCSRRSSRPFVAINCANLSPDMLENEIFGHAKGAFTGASAPTKGIAAAANGGTLFLDEIDTLPAASQAKILRFAELKEYRRLGENFTRRADVRLIAASNADLADHVRQGRFRKDLYFRLRVAPVHIAPLAERPEDVAVLLDHFCARYAQETGNEPIRLSRAVRNRLLQYHWPGNVRELQNCVRYLTCLMLDRPVELEDLPPLEPAPDESSGSTSPHGRGESAASADVLAQLADRPMNEAKDTVIEAFERHYLDEALTRTNGNVAQAARRSGRNRRTIFQLLHKYGLTASAYRD